MIPAGELTALLGAGAAVVAAIAALIRSVRSERRTDASLSRLWIDASDRLHQSESGLRQDLAAELAAMRADLEVCRQDRAEIHRELDELRDRPCPRADCPIYEMVD